MFIVCHSFLIQAHGAIKYIGKCLLLQYLLSFTKDIAFLHHNIPFVYIMIITRFYITIYHLLQLSWHYYTLSNVAMYKPYKKGTTDNIIKDPC